MLVPECEEQTPGTCQPFPRFCMCGSDHWTEWKVLLLAMGSQCPWRCWGRKGNFTEPWKVRWTKCLLEKEERGKKTSEENILCIVLHILFIVSDMVWCNLGWPHSLWSAVWPWSPCLPFWSSQFVQCQGLNQGFVCASSFINKVTSHPRIHTQL